MDIQMKMEKEIEDVVGYGRLPSMSDKPNLPYCEAVMHESLRLGNVVPFSVPHHVTNDIFYKGYTIPKNSVIIPSLDSVVYDEKLFPDSHIFKPERFLDANGKVCGQDKALTFSLGELSIIPLSPSLLYLLRSCYVSVGCMRNGQTNALKNKSVYENDCSLCYFYLSEG